MNKFHLGVYAIIEENGHILLIQKGRGPYKGKLDLPGGKPEWGENPLETLQREVYEETNLLVKKADLLTIHSTTIPFDKTGKTWLHHMGIIYSVSEYVQKSCIKITKNDALGYDFYLISDLQKDQVTPFAWHYLLQQKK